MTTYAMCVGPGLHAFELACPERDSLIPAQSGVLEARCPKCFQKHLQALRRSRLQC